MATEEEKARETRSGRMLTTGHGGRATTRSQSGGRRYGPTSPVDRTAYARVIVGETMF